MSPRKHCLLNNFTNYYKLLLLATNWHSSNLLGCTVVSLLEIVTLFKKTSQLPIGTGFKIVVTNMPLAVVVCSAVAACTISHRDRM